MTCKTVNIPEVGNVSVNDSGQMHVVLRGAVCPSCSTSTPLLAAGVYTGEAVDMLDYGIIFISSYSDVTSATDGLSLEQSHDGTNWDFTDVYTVPAATGKIYAIQPAARYFRVKYTNGGTDQTAFRLQVVLKKTNSLPTSHRLQDTLIDDDDASLVKSILSAKDPTGDYVNINSTSSSNLRVTDAENGLAIAKGDVTNTTFIHKFGNAPDFDTGDSPVTIWDGANDASLDEMQYNYSTTAAIDSLSSSNAGDTQDIEIQGLDSNYDLVTQTITLTGQTRAALSTSLIRVFRLKNVGSTDLAGSAYVYENTAISGGVPTDTTKVRAMIENGNNQTLMAVYTIPNGYTGYMRDWYAATSGASRDSAYVIDLYARPFGQVFQLKHKSALNDTGSTYIQHKYEEPEKFTEKTDIEMRVTLADASKTAASVSGGFDIVLIQN